MYNYLTEDSLYELLTHLYTDFEIIRNKIVPNSNIKNRPDFRIESKKLIIEFDGYRHYTMPNVILTDINKDKVYSSIGYTVIRIPYFIQMTFELQKLLFDTVCNVETSYPHGFIDDAALLPAAYCELGIIRFKNDLEKFKLVYADIINSLKYKNKPLLEILPPSPYVS